MKRNPTTRQSADHSMVYILSRLLKRAQELGVNKLGGKTQNEFWQQLMLLPTDYSRTSIADPDTRKLMDLIDFKHGGSDYDTKYPEGIPTSIIIIDKDNKTYDSGLIMFPAGHAANKEHNLIEILNTKFQRLAALAVGENETKNLIQKLQNLKNKSNHEIDLLYEANIHYIPISNTGNNNKQSNEEDENVTEY